MTTWGTGSRGGGGFTLAELLLVVGLIGLFSVLVLPRVAATLRWGGAERTARILDAGVTAARDRAVATGRPHDLVVDLDRRLVRVEEVVEDPEGRWSVGRPLREARTRGVTLPEGVEVAVALEDGLRRRGVARIRATPDGHVDPARFLFGGAPSLQVHPLTALVEPPSPPVAAAAPAPPFL